MRRARCVSSTPRPPPAPKNQTIPHMRVMPARLSTSRCQVCLHHVWHKFERVWTRVTQALDESVSPVPVEVDQPKVNACLTTAELEKVVDEVVLAARAKLAIAVLAQRLNLASTPPAQVCRFTVFRFSVLHFHFRNFAAISTRSQCGLDEIWRELRPTLETVRVSVTDN